MNILSDLQSIFFKAKSEERNTSSIQNPQSWAINAFSGSSSAPTEANVSAIAVAYACRKVIAESIGSLSWSIFERKGGSDSVEAFDHPLYPILNGMMSPRYDAINFKEIITSQAVFGGNGYANIIRNGKSEITEVDIWNPPDVSVYLNSKRHPLYENLNNKGKKEKYTDIFHLRAMAIDPETHFVQGISPLKVAANTFSLSVAAQNYGKNFYENGAQPSALLTHPFSLSEEAASRIKTTFIDKHTGPQNAGSVVLLEEGMQYTALSMSPSDAKFLELSRFQLAEVARIFRVPLHLLQDLERATNNNIEQLAIDFLVHTLRPWVKRWESELNNKFLLPSERKKFFIRFNLDAILRGDTKARGEFYSKMFNIGVFSQNDIRKLENLNSIEGGDEYYVPVNLINPLKPNNDESKPDPTGVEETSDE